MRISASREQKNREAKQRRIVRERDVERGERPRCLMEKFVGGRWRQCGKLGANQTIHIVKRDNCGDYWDEPIVAILGCLECHRTYDLNYLGKPKYRVRVPFEPAANAWVFLLERFEDATDPRKLKTKPIARFNPFANPDYADIIGAVS